MQARVQDFYEYLFTEKANLESGIPSDLKQEHKHQQIEKKRKNIVSFFDDIKKNDSEKFRAAIRELKNINKGYLENILYGNSTDNIEEKKYFPDEALIDKQFEELENRYHLFSDIDPNNKINQFRIYFKICKLIADFVEHTNSINDQIVYQQAYAMMAIFGDQKPPKYFQTFCEYLKNQNYLPDRYPFYNILMSELPTNSLNYPINLADWRNIIYQSGSKGLQLFRRANEITEKLSGNTPSKYIEALKIARALTYKRADEYPELAELCLHYNVPEVDFNYALKIKKQIKKSDQLPNIIVNGNEIGAPGYYLIKLPPDDVRGYLLGEITNCCQSIGGNGETCVFDGLTRENNGFLIMVKAKGKNNTESELLKKGKIRGQGYIWRSDFGNLVIDSWENLNPDSEDEIAVKLLKHYAKNVVEQKNSDCLRVTIGTGGKTPAHHFEQDAACPETMREGEQYEDSLQQKIVYSDTLRCQEPASLIKKKLHTLLGDTYEANIIDKMIEKNDIYSIHQAQDILSLLDDSEFQKYIKNRKNLDEFIEACSQGPLIWNILSKLSQAKLCKAPNIDDKKSYASIDFIIYKIKEFDFQPALEKIFTILNKTKTLNNTIYPKILQLLTYGSISKLADLLSKLQSRNILTSSLVQYITYYLSPHNFSSFGAALIKLHENNLLTSITISKVQQDPDRAGMIADIEIALTKDLTQINLGQIIGCLAENGKIKLIDDLINRSKLSDINLLKYHRETPLMLAAASGRLNVVEYFLDKNADVNAVDNNGRSSLLHAIENEHCDVAEKLLEQKDLDVNLSDDEGNTPLLLALALKDSSARRSMTNLLLKHPSVIINKRSKCGYNPLYYACWQGDTKTVETLIARKAEINVATRSKAAKPASGCTPLHVTIYQGNLDIINLLLSHKANINAKTDTGITPLHLAVEFRNEKITTFLLENKNININEQDQDGETPLHLVTKKLNPCFEILLNHPNINLNSLNRSGESPLFIAIREHSFLAIRMLLKKGADPNIINIEGNNILQLAIETAPDNDFYFEMYCGNIVKELLETKDFNRELINTKNKTGLTPLDLVFKKKQFYAAEILINNGAKFNCTSQTEIMNSIFYIIKRCEKNKDLPQDHQDQIEQQLINLLTSLLRQHTDLAIDTKNTDGLTPLYLAASVGNKKIVELLIEKKADITIRDKFDNNLLHAAAVSQQGGQLISSLVKSGFNINEKNSDNETPLFIAIKHHDIDTIKFLIQNCANVNTVNAEGATPLLIAINEFYSNSSEIVNLFIQAGADIDAKDANGDSVLHLATRNSLKTFSLLLESKANIASINQNGDTLIHSIAQTGNALFIDALSNYFLSPSLNPNSKNSEGLTALHLAVMRGDHALIASIANIKGINFEVANSNGLTALEIAIHKNDLFTIQILLSHEVDISRVLYTTDNDLIRSYLLFKEPITQELLNNLKNEIAKLKKLDLQNQEYIFSSLIEIDALLKSDLPMQVQYLKVIEILQSILLEFEEFNSPRDRLFTSSVSNPKESNIYSQIYSFLHEIEKTCRLPLELPSGQFKLSHSAADQKHNSNDPRP